jgi:hypothetical protein
MGGGGRFRISPRTISPKSSVASYRDHSGTDLYPAFNFAFESESSFHFDTDLDLY